MFGARLDVSQAVRAFERLGAQVNSASSLALTRAIASAKTDLGRNVAKDISLKVGVVNEALTVQSPTPTSLTALISAAVRRIPLIDFGARGPEPSRGRGPGVTAKVQGQRKVYPRAFIATAGHHRGVWQRHGTGARLPITELKGPSVAHVAAKHAEAAAARGQAVFIERLKHEIGRLIREVATTR